MEGASMRPPHECGGKQDGCETSCETNESFNEAPARMRGKTWKGEWDAAATYELQ